jgi:transposase-like protein
MASPLAHPEQKKYDIIKYDGKRKLPMGQPLHFLKRSAARTLSAWAVSQMSETEAYSLFLRLRWPETDGVPSCPHCGTLRCYDIRTRQIFKCSACRKTFSAKSGTIFHSTKLPYAKVLYLIILFVNAAKGISALQISRDIGINYKSAFVLLHKLRQAIEEGRSNMTLDGEVEIDGAYYGGHTRPANAGKMGQKAAKEAGKRDQAKLTKKLCILVMVQRNGCTIPMLVKSETTQAALNAASKHIKPGSTIYADEHRSYDALHAWYATHRINHQRAFADGAISTNQAESFHSRMRRAEIGQYHRISGKYLLRYAWEAAYRSDRRRTDNGAVFYELTELAATHPVSRDWKGYWQARGAGREKP